MRIIAVTNRNLEMGLAYNLFREDLYYHLKVVTIWLSSLSERQGDIRLLANYFLSRYTAEIGIDTPGVSDEAMAILRKDNPVKKHKFVCYPDEGVCRMDMTGDKEDLASLDDAQVHEIARLAAILQDYYGTPQDIEWAIQDDGSIIILQCRPLKQTAVEKGQERRFEGGEDLAPIYDFQELL